MAVSLNFIDTYLNMVWLLCMWLLEMFELVQHYFIPRKITFNSVIYKNVSPHFFSIHLFFRSLYTLSLPSLTFSLSIYFSLCQQYSLFCMQFTVHPLWNAIQHSNVFMPYAQCECVTHYKNTRTNLHLSCSSSIQSSQYRRGFCNNHVNIWNHMNMGTDNE